jgi:secreted Zn-dependent insulinase-like peptidase
MGFQLELIFNFNFNYLTLLYNIILSFKVVIRCWCSQVYDVHLKSLSSWETEPLQRQVKTLLTRLLTTRNHSKLEKLKAAKQITFDDVSTFARRFFVDHSTECFFFGDLNVERAEELSTIVLNERTKFLEKLAESENIKVKKLFC